MINSKKAALAILGGLLLIGSCASEPKWTKPGVTAEQLKQDKAVAPGRNYAALTTHMARIATPRREICTFLRDLRFP